VQIFHEHLSPKQSRKDWKCCSSGRESAMQTLRPEFKALSNQKIKKEKNAENDYR
jgi:hypothetical protein